MEKEHIEALETIKKNVETFYDIINGGCDEFDHDNNKNQANSKDSGSNSSSGQYEEYKSLMKERCMQAFETYKKRLNELIQTLQNSKSRRKELRFLFTIYSRIKELKDDYLLFVTQYGEIIKRYNVESIQYTISTIFQKTLLSLKSSLDSLSSDDDVLIKPNILFITVSGMNYRLLKEYISRNHVQEEFPSLTKPTSPRKGKKSHRKHGHKREWTNSSDFYSDLDQRNDKKNSNLSFDDEEQISDSEDIETDSINVIDVDIDENTNSNENNQSQYSSSILNRSQSSSEIDQIVNQLNIRNKMEPSLYQEVLRLRVHSNIPDNKQTTNYIKNSNTLFRNYSTNRYSLPFLSWFHNHSLQLPNHYTAAAGIHPGRATLFTGQMPSVHNVTNTIGGIKTVFACDHTYLIPNECPTIGHYLQLENYDVSYKGVWDLSETYGSREGLLSLYDDDYSSALKPFGFLDWDNSNYYYTGSRRDYMTTKSAVEYIHSRSMVYEETIHKESKPPSWALFVTLSGPEDVTDLEQQFQELPPLLSSTVQTTLGRDPTSKLISSTSMKANPKQSNNPSLVTGTPKNNRSSIFDSHRRGILPLSLSSIHCRLNSIKNYFTNSRIQESSFINNSKDSIHTKELSPAPLRDSLPNPSTKSILYKSMEVSTKDSESTLSPYKQRFFSLNKSVQLNPCIPSSIYYDSVNKTDDNMNLHSPSPLDSSIVHVETNFITESIHQNNSSRSYSVGPISGLRSPNSVPLDPEEDSNDGSISPNMTTPSDAFESDNEFDQSSILYKTDKIQDYKQLHIRCRSSTDMSTNSSSQEFECETDDETSPDQSIIKRYSEPHEQTTSVSLQKNESTLEESKKQTINHLNHIIEQNLQYRLQQKRNNSGNLNSKNQKNSKLFSKLNKNHTSHKQSTRNYIKHALPEKESFEMSKAQRSYLDYCHYYYDIKIKRKKYLHRLQETDLNIGKILNEIFHTSYRNNTIIVFTSDCGSMVGNRGLWGSYHSGSEDIYRVPCYIYIPPCIRGKETITLPDDGLLTSSLDVLPTLLGLIGCDIDNRRRILSHNYSQSLPFPGRDLYHIFMDYYNWFVDHKKDKSRQLPKMNELDPFISASLNHQLQLNIKNINHSIDLSHILDCVYFDNIDAIERCTLHNASHLYYLYETITQSNISLQIQGAPYVEGIIIRLKYQPHDEALIFKLVHFYDLPSLWSHPYKYDTGYSLLSVNNEYYCENYIKYVSDSSEYELYDLIQDPQESKDLLLTNNNPEYKELFSYLKKILKEMRKSTRLRKIDYSKSSSLPKIYNYHNFVDYCYTKSSNLLHNYSQFISILLIISTVFFVFYNTFF